MGEWHYLYLLLFQLDHICKSELGMPLNWLKDNLAVPTLLGQLNPLSQARQASPVMSGYTTVLFNMGVSENRVQYPIPSHAESFPCKWQFNGKQKPQFSDKLTILWVKSMIFQTNPAMGAAWRCGTQPAMHLTSWHLRDWAMLCCFASIKQFPQASIVDSTRGSYRRATCVAESCPT